MRNKKLLFILIPVIIIVLALIGGLIYIKLNSTPKKIFTTSIDKVLTALETEQEQYNTLKSKIELSANIESDDEDIEEIADILDTSKITINSEIDKKNLLVNGNIDVTYDSESIVNASVLLQDEKLYFSLKDWLDKYIEVPTDDLEFSQSNQLNAETIDTNLLLKSIKKELISELEKQQFSQEKVTLNLDGKETKVTKSSIKLTEEQAVNIIKEFLGNLKQNSEFQNGLGEYKNDVIDAINQILEDTPTENFDEQSKIAFSIYTKGLLNEFVAVDFTVENSEKTTDGIELIKQNTGKYEFSIYENNEEERENIIKAIIQNEKENKNKGTTKISLYNEEDVMDFVYKYEKKDKQTTFELSTVREEVNFVISGNIIENGSSYSGSIILSAEVPEYGKVNINCLFNMEYNAVIEKVNVSNATTVDEMSKEDQEEFMTNLQNSKLYEIISENALVNTVLATENALSKLDEPIVKIDGQTVRYTVPDGFEASEYNSEDYKIYSDSNYNTITVYMEQGNRAENYLRSIENEYVLTSSNYKNQQLSETSSYPINGKEYKYRNIRYDDDYGTYVNLYFVNEIKDGYIYVVEVETENGNISMETINNFLDVTVTDY